MDKLNKTMESLTFEFFGSSEYKTDPSTFLYDDDSVLVDIRCKEEIETISLNLLHHIPVINIPLNELPTRINELPKDKRLGLFCSSGVRIAMAFLYLKTVGFDNVVMLSGGLNAIVNELKPGKIHYRINN